MKIIHIINDINMYMYTLSDMLTIRKLLQFLIKEGHLIM